jgi:hypothetical protein
VTTSRGWRLVCCWAEKKEEEMRGRCAMKMQFRVGVGVEVEVVRSWSSKE